MSKKEPDKNSAINQLLTEIQKTYGKGVCYVGSEGFINEIEVIPTKIEALDKALVIGGFPRGRIIEISGMEGSGKSTLCLQTIANIQKNGGIASLIDVEHALDPSWAKKCGVDIEKLIISQPDYAEQALEILEMQIRSGVIDLIVVDSVAALVPKVEVEGDMDSQQIGIQSRLMSKAMRKIAGIVSKTKTTVIFINQLRDKIGVMFGEKTTTPGGRALKYNASIRVKMNTSGKEKKTVKGVITCIGHKIKCVIIKNRMAPAYREAEIMFLYDKGIIDV